MRIALMGTRGVPARYGGFETCVEEVGRRLVDRGTEVTVYCRQPDAKAASYLGMRLVHLPALRLKAAETLSHSFLSVLHVLLSRRKPDVVFLFNAANAVLIPLLKLRRIPVVVHMDGIEWKRSKWGRAGRAWYRLSEQLAVAWADALIADAEGIARYLRDAHGVTSELIAYGAPRVERTETLLLPEDWRADSFYLSVSRFEPENHVLEIVQGYILSDVTLPLLVVGAGPYSDRYAESIRMAASADRRVVLIGSVWDQPYLDQLYARCRAYIHGHSVGGTNPSLLRAVGAGASVIAWDNEFNREVTQNQALYCLDAASLAAQLNSHQKESPQSARSRARVLNERLLVKYDWDAVSLQYEQLAGRVARLHRSSEDHA